MKYLLLIFSLLIVHSSKPSAASAAATVPESMQHCPENYHAMEASVKEDIEKIYKENLAAAEKPENIAAYQTEVRDLVVAHSPIIKDIAPIIAGYVGSRPVLWGCTLEQAGQRPFGWDWERKKAADNPIRLFCDRQGIIDPAGLAGKNYDDVVLRQNPIQITRANAFDFAIQPIGKHPFARILLSKCGLSKLADNWLGNQPFLGTLYLEDNQFTKVPSGLAWSGPLFLTMIDLSHNRITQVSYQDFRTAPYLKWLGLGHNLLTGFPTEEFLKLKHLTHVFLSDNPFTGPYPNNVAEGICNRFWQRKDSSPLPAAAKNAVIAELKRKFGN